MPNMRRLAESSGAILDGIRSSSFGRTAKDVQPYAKELAYLLLQVLAVATFTAWLYSSNPLFRNVYRNSMVCLGIGVVVFHILAYRHRGRLTKHVTRLIDYVYLGVGAIGLLNASDYTVRIYRDQVQHVVRQSLDDLRLLPALQMDAYRSTCSDDRLEKACTAYTEIFNIAHHAQTSDPSEKSSYLVRGVLTQMTQVAGSEPRVRASLERYVQNPYEDLDQLKLLDDEPFGYDTFGAPAGPDPVREFGFYLVASALALRLTKVSIEVFN